MFLAAAMVFSVVSFELPSVFAGTASVNETGSVSVTAPPAISVSATKVARVASAANSLLPGSVLVKATPSGVPDLGTATYANAAYAGETPTWPSASIIFPAGISPDAATGVTITATTSGGSVTMSSVSEDGQVYTASITGGTATAGNNIVYLISYYIDGTNYTTYAYSYVESIVIPSGIQYSRRANLNFLGGTGGRMYFNYRYLGINVYGSEVSGSATHGYFDYASASYVENPSSPNNVQLLISKDGGTARAYNGGYGADANRPQASVYMDTSLQDSLDDLNLRIAFFLNRDISSDSTNINLSGTYVQAGNVASVSADDTQDAPATDATATAQLGITGTSAVMATIGDNITAAFSGPGPSTSGTSYTVTMLNQAPPSGSGYTLWAYTSVGLTAYKYDKGALRAKINDIISGAAGKGINPQSWFYTSGWDTFKAAYDQANLILNKPNTDQTTINAALSSLNTAYNSLAPKVFTYTVNYFIQGTTTPIIPAVTATGSYSGYVLLAIAEDIPGYILTPYDQSPAKMTLTAENKTINFYYVAKTYTVSFESNGGSAVSPLTQAFNTAITKPSDPVKTNYTFTGWYSDEACTQPVTWPYSMPLNGGTLYAGWTLTPVTLSFNSNFGTAVLPVTAVPGTSIDEPSAPDRPGYAFNGWYYDISFSSPVTWPMSLPYNSLTVYAKWTLTLNTITFESNGGTLVAQITSEPNVAIYPPNAPVKTGYTFIGWFYDNGTFVNAVQWPVVLNGTGFTVYAKWAPNTTTITFDSQGGSTVAPLSASVDSAITAPEPPRYFGYVFAGWTLNGNAYTFSTMPNHNITLVAAWVATSKAVSVKLDVFKTVGGDLVPAAAARAGDILTVVLSAKTNFYCGASRYVIMYDSSFYKIVGANKAAIHPNLSNPYYANAIDSYAGATTSPVSQWPATFVNGESSKYMFVAANFTASSSAANGGYPLKQSDAASLFTIQLQVKADAAGSGHIFMDKRWDRSTINNPTGGQYYYYCTSGTMLSTSGDPGVDLDSDYIDANETIALDTSVPVVSTISFNTAGGSAIDSISGEAGTTANPPANPVKEGYTFTGWSPAFPSVYPATNITLTAQWQINSYNAVFMVDGSVYSTVQTLYGASILAPANPLKSGYTFTGWSPAVGTMGAADKTFTAMFTVNLYNAYFVVDGQIYVTVATEYGAPIQLPADPFKEGYTFTGWDPVPGTMGAANATFTAQFSVITYNAYFVVDGAPYATVPTDYGKQIAVPAVPTKPYYSFVGWTPAVGIMGAADITFNALWEATVFNANFMVDGSPYVTVKTNEGQPISLPPNPAKEGYTFTGWDSVPAVMPSGDVTINATWEINTYHAVFKVDGMTYQTVPAVYGTVINVPQSPSKAGYTFTGWTPAVPSAMPAHDLIFNAQFTANKYNAVFKVDGNDFAVVPTDFGTEIVLPPNPVKTGYTFVGWLGVPSIMPAEDVVINASFSVNTHTARFMVDGSLYSETVTSFGSTIELPAEPYKTGYTFTGWDFVPSAMPDNNVDINATFTKNAYKATFIVDGAEYAVVTTGYGEYIDLPAIPGKTGYSFMKWNNLPETMPAEDVIITGVWAVNSYDAVFYVDGAEYKTVTTEYGAEIQLPAIPVKTGFYFGGWDPLVPVTMPAYALEFNAIWVSQAYNAIFMVDGAEYAKVLTGIGAPVIAPADPVKTGYIFIGWDPGVPSAMPAYDVTLTALWYASNVTVDFNLNGGTGVVPASQTGVEGTVVTLPPQGDIMKDTYIFLGWSTDPNATQGLASYLMPSANTTLYAVWSTYMLGDTNLDGTVSVIDAVLTLRASSGLVTLTELQQNQADVNKDGSITVIDALLILRYSSGLITHF